MMQHAHDEVPGPRPVNPGLDPNDRIVTLLKMAYHEAALVALAALLAIDLKKASVDDIIRVILDKTRHIEPFSLLPRSNDNSVKVAFVYALWLIDGAVGDETRSILEQKKNAIFTQAGVDSDANVKRFFNRIMSEDHSIQPAAPAHGPLSSKMKLLETISRIVDLVEHSQPGG
jgi:hypothetical protein